MKHKRPFTPVIVVDAASGQPMTWGGQQFVHIRPIRIRSVKETGDTVKVFMRQDAIQLIESDYAFRKRNNLTMHRLDLVLASVGKGVR